MPKYSLQKLYRSALGEIGAVVAIGVIALGVLVFALIADEAVEGDTHAFDMSILLALREPGTRTILSDLPGSRQRLRMLRRWAAMRC